VLSVHTTGCVCNMEAHKRRAAVACFAKTTTQSVGEGVGCAGATTTTTPGPYGDVTSKCTTAGSSSSTMLL
jgi:hypothetical protein